MIPDPTRRRFIQSSTQAAAATALGALAPRWSGRAATADGAVDWQAGVARAVITPETNVWLAGYGSKRAPEGKLHDLWAKALALRDSRGNRVVMITSDFQGVPKAVSDEVFGLLRRRFGLQRAEVMLTFSTTTAGPGSATISWTIIRSSRSKCGSCRSTRR